MSVEIAFGDLQIVDAGPRPFGASHPGSARVGVTWRRHAEDGVAADVVEVRAIVDYDLSQSVLDKRRHARSRLAEILEQAAADLKAWRDPNDLKSDSDIVG